MQKHTQHYNNIVKYVKAEHFVNGETMHVKHNELTYIDPINQKVFKRVFKSDISLPENISEKYPVAKIVEQNKNYQSSYDFVMQYVPGTDVYMTVMNEPHKAKEVLVKFDNFLAKWVNYKSDSEVITALSIDINPGNFIISESNGEIIKVDYVADWGSVEKPLWFYLKPYHKLLKGNFIPPPIIEDIVNERFKNHKTRKLNFDILMQEFKTKDEDISFSEEKPNDLIY